MLILKTADFYHAMVRQILAIDKNIAEILQFLIKIPNKRMYARKKWSSCVSRQRMADYEKETFFFASLTLSFTIIIPVS